MTRKQIFQFIISLCLISWIAQIAIIKLAGPIGSEASIPFMFALMFLPGLFGLIYTIRYKAIRKSVQIIPRNITPFILAIIIPAMIALAILAIIQIFGIGQSNYFLIQEGKVSIKSGPWTLGTGSQNPIHFSANILITFFLFASIASLATIGEEYGWRGVLQNAMIREFGFIRGVSALGLVWAIWHMPVILSGYNYPETPILGAFILLPALLVGASFIMAWLTLWNRSFWPAILMHGAINSVYDSMITKVTLESSTPLIIPVIEISIFAIISLAIIFWLHRRMNNGAENTAHSAS